MTHLGKYQLHETLGRGGYGTVYRATDTALEVERAIKVLHPALAADPDFIERFRREARLAARLRHPNIAPVYDLDEDQGRYYLAMDYLPGGSLKDRLAKDGGLPFAEALRIVQQAAAALDYAHAQGLVHRDIKPGNILFEADGTARLIDFGFAKALAGASSASLSAAGGMIGTPAYMAPEVWREQPVTPATDVYSLACVLGEMLNGQALFPGDSPAGLMTRHLMDGPQFPTQWPQDMPPGLNAALAKALAKEPSERFASAGEFAGALETPRNADTRARRDAEARVETEKKANPNTDEKGIISQTDIKTLPDNKNPPGVLAAVALLIFLWVLGGLISGIGTAIGVFLFHHVIGGAFGGAFGGLIAGLIIGGIGTSEFLRAHKKIIDRKLLENITWGWCLACSAGAAAGGAIGWGMNNVLGLFIGFAVGTVIALGIGISNMKRQYRKSQK